MRKRLFGLFVVGSLTACAQVIGANEYESIDPKDSSTSAETSVDTGEPIDSTIVDSGAPDSDVDSTLVDSDVDSTVDSTIVDSGVDSTVVDSFVADTFKPDTFVPDTFVADTFVPDTFVPDTFVPDTFVPDTFKPDTCVASTEVCNGLDDNCDGTPDNAPLTSMCPLASHTTSATCGGVAGCKTATCEGGWDDFNGLWADGCECQQYANKHTCGDVEIAGPISIGLGATNFYSGNLTLAGREDWFNFNFATGGHPIIQFSANPSTAFRIDVVPTCGTAAIGCGIEGGGAAGITVWETQQTGGTMTMPGPQVRVRVTRAVGTPDCSTYTLRVSN